MDRNSIIGLFLIGLLVLGYSIYTQPSAEQLAAEKHRKDSLELLARKQEAASKALAQQQAAEQVAATADTTGAVSDSAKAQQLQEQWGAFAAAADGKEQLVTLENDKIRLTLSSLGGKVKRVELKDYKTWDGRAVELMSSDSSRFDITFPAQNRIINTGQLNFQIVEGGTTGKASLRLNAGDGKYLQYNYSLEPGSYLVELDLKVVGLHDLLPANTTYLNLDWKDQLNRQEQSVENERTATTLYYRFTGEEVDYISETSDEKQSLKTKVQWIAFKQHFFSSVLIADGISFDAPVVETFTDKNQERYVKNMTASMSLPLENKPEQDIRLRFYFGPNHYQSLKQIDDLHLEKLIPLGWGIFGWVNRYLVIPTFNYLNGFNLNFGIIILILTILVRIILLPLTYGSFKSQAKIRVLQPEMLELNEKYGDDPMKKQQETMNLYRRAGVNPLGGCIPGLLQLPILIAMFRFFPASIELRQESFLWAHDLSTYDSILDLGFKIPFYGDHVSLFTLLMTISTIIYTKMNMQMTAATNPSMKWMMYLMPIFFLGFFNNYSAGLSYYYFLSNIFGFAQQYLFKAFIDEDAIHAKIQENKKKPAKKSGFQARLEAMAKEAQRQQAAKKK
ncbi:membrane protein insertase YidC [Candidatus Pollutiaquabacter sp.]|uniref:membrane protein insertase YidC n=1 Tax=Candidatus Pollutiaquabacter sp. TaxID=3416354 RepID=UPI003CA79F5E|nr:membrane protein insertase YidC [Bacteroidota bacterium]